MCYTPPIMNWIEQGAVGAGLGVAACLVPGVAEGVVAGAMMCAAVKVVNYVRTGSFAGEPSSFSPCCIGFIGPLIEEVIFRGYLIGMVGQVASAILFGFVHGSWEQGIIAFSCGLLVLGPLYTTLGLGASIGAHMTHNLITSSLAASP